MQPTKSNRSPKINNTATGTTGEMVAAQYLERQGFQIIARNRRWPFAEIDLIARRRETVHFVEVKTVSHETKANLEWAVTHETWRPEEQVHYRKLHQIRKGVQAWLVENRYTGNFQIDVIAVRIVPRETYSSINWIQNVIIEEL